MGNWVVKIKEILQDSLIKSELSNFCVGTIFLQRVFQTKHLQTTKGNDKRHQKRKH